MDKKTTKMVHMVAFALLVVGGLNWGLIGIFSIDLVQTVFGLGSSLTKIIYILIGISAVYTGATHMTDCKICSEKKS